MKIEKSKLNKALKQIGIFIKKSPVAGNASLVHFHNAAGKATVFATDLASAGRVSFATDEQGEFDFCVEYAQLAQTTRVRGKEINAEITKEDGFENGAVVLGDGTTKFVCAMHDVNEILELESAAVVPNFQPLVVDAKTLKTGLREGGFARNEKDADKVFAHGINLKVDGDTLEIASLDNKRIACWRKQLQGELFSPVQMSGMLGNRAIQAINLFDDEDTVRVYLDDKKIIVVSDTYEAYAMKIQCRFPDFNPFFQKEILSTFEVKNADVNESLAITVSDGFNSDVVELDFGENSAKIVTTGKSGELAEDSFPCTRTSGTDEKVLLATKYFSDIFHFLSREKMTFEFRDMGNGMKMFSYKTDDGVIGLIAPRQKG